MFGLKTGFDATSNNQTIVICICFAVIFIHSVTRGQKSCFYWLRTCGKSDQQCVVCVYLTMLKAVIDKAHKEERCNPGEVRRGGPFLVKTENTKNKWG